MVVSDYFGPKVELRFGYVEYFEKDFASKRFISRATVLDSLPNETLHIHAEDEAKLGHAALYCAFIHYDEERDVELSYHGTQISLQEAQADKDLTLPYMTNNEIENRFESIKIHRGVLTEEDKTEIALNALMLVVGFIKKEESAASPRKRRWGIRFR